MLLIISRNEDRPELESKILAAAFRQSVERGDIDGSRLAHRELVGLLARKAQSSRAASDNVDQLERVFASDNVHVMDLQTLLRSKVSQATTSGHNGSEDPGTAPAGGAGALSSQEHSSGGSVVPSGGLSVDGVAGASLPVDAEESMAEINDRTVVQADISRSPEESESGWFDVSPDQDLAMFQPGESELECLSFEVPAGEEKMPAGSRRSQSSSWEDVSQAAEISAIEKLEFPDSQIWEEEAFQMSDFELADRESLESAEFNNSVGTEELIELTESVEIAEQIPTEPTESVDIAEQIPTEPTESVEIAEQIPTEPTESIDIAEQIPTEPTESVEIAEQIPTEPTESVEIAEQIPTEPAESIDIAEQIPTEPTESVEIAEQIPTELSEPLETSVTIPPELSSSTAPLATPGLAYDSKSSALPPQVAQGKQKGRKGHKKSKKDTAARNAVAAEKSPIRADSVKSSEPISRSESSAAELIDPAAILKAAMKNVVEEDVSSAEPQLVPEEQETAESLKEVEVELEKTDFVVNDFELSDSAYHEPISGKPFEPFESPSTMILEAATPLSDESTLADLSAVEPVLGSDTVSDAITSFDQAIAEGATPANYLDFGGESAPPAPPPAPPPEIYAQIDFEDATPVDSQSIQESSHHSISSLLASRSAPNPEAPDYYSWIGAESTDPFFLLHVCYLRAVRALIMRQYFGDKNFALNTHDFKRQLKNMGVAFNILFDPRTRLDYDLRQMGLRVPDQGTGLTIPEDAKIPEGGGKIRLSLSELLIVCRMFDADQMLAIVNAARLLTEKPFWTYLAESGLLTAVELDSIRTAYQLICNGLLTIIQFEQAFQYVRIHQQQLLEILLAAGWLRLEDLQEFANSPDHEAIPEAPRFIEAKIQDEPVIPASNIQVNAIMPSWMHWGDDEEPKDSPLAATQENVAMETAGGDLVPPMVQSAAAEFVDGPILEEIPPTQEGNSPLDFSTLLLAAQASLSEKPATTLPHSANVIEDVPHGLSEALSAAQTKLIESADISIEDVPPSLSAALSAAQMPGEFESGKQKSSEEEEEEETD